MTTFQGELVSDFPLEVLEELGGVPVPGQDYDRVDPNRANWAENSGKEWVPDWRAADPEPCQEEVGVQVSAVWDEQGADD